METKILFPSPKLGLSLKFATRKRIAGKIGFRPLNWGYL